MSELDMLTRISDLETAIRVVVFFWVVTIVAMSSLHECDCHPRHVCPDPDDGPMCPLHKQPRNRCERYHKE
jgi:hypothetical protein